MTTLLLIALSFFFAPAQAAICDHPQAQESIQVICGLRAAMIAKYSLQDWKKQELGLDTGKQLEHCAERMKANSDRLYRSERFARIELEDHLLLCLAPFRDSHLQLKSQTPRPFVYAGFQLIQAGNRFLIGSVSKSLSGQWPAEAESLLRPGAEVESLNGFSPTELVKLASHYISGSSEAFVAEEALRALTFRDFAYPESGTLLVKVANQMAVPVPWWQVGLNQREDTRALFRERGFLSAHSIALDIEARIRDGEDDLGFNHKAPLLPKESLTSFYDDEGQLGMRLGQFEQEGKSYCYIQLLTFATKRWRVKSTAGKIVPFTFPFEQHLQGCRIGGRPLVLDLRWNPGGDSDAPARILGLLARTGESYPSTVFGGLLTPHLQAVLSKFDLGEGFPSGGLRTPQGRMLKALEFARGARSRYLPFVASENIASTMKGGAFDLPIVALTTPSCISACDLLAGLLRNAKRAILLGGPTNGAGGRFLEVGKYPRSGYTDDLFGTVTLKIPNTFHALLPRLKAENEWFFDFPENQPWMMENRPISPDLAYGNQVLDIEAPGAGWLRASVQAILDHEKSRLP